MLADRKRWWRAGDVAEASGIPAATVRTLLRRLVQADMLDNDRKLGYRVKDGVSLD